MCEAGLFADSRGSTCFARGDGRKSVGPNPAQQQRDGRGAEEKVERRPISFTKSGERTLRGGLGIGFPSTQHDGPMRRLKRSAAFLQCSRDCLRGWRASPTRRSLARIKSFGGSVVAAGPAARERNADVTPAATVPVPAAYALV